MNCYIIAAYPSPPRSRRPYRVVCERVEIRYNRPGFDHRGSIYASLPRLVTYGPLEVGARNKPEAIRAFWSHYNRENRP